MSTIKLTVGAIDSGISGTKQMSGMCDDAAARIGKAANEISELSFSSQTALTANIRNIQKRLSKQANLMEQYTNAMREAQDELMAADGSFGAESASLWNRVMGWVSDGAQKISLALKNAFSSNEAVAGLFLSAVSTAIITHVNWLNNSLKNSIDSKKEPLYIRNSNDELDKMKSEMMYPTASTGWNYPDRFGNHSISCYYFANWKLKERGIDKLSPDYGNDMYLSWKAEHPGADYTNTSADYIEYLIKNNNDEPLYNIYIEGDFGANATHTMLIDKAYMKDGELILFFSDNANLIKPVLPVASNPDNVKNTYQLMEQVTMTKEQFNSAYKTTEVYWEVPYAKAPNRIICYGLQDTK